jgi:hypothetical protein
LRDADVLISGIHAPVEAAALDKTGFAELLEMLRHERQRRRDEVRAALRGSSWTKLHLYLILWPRTLAGNPNLGKSVGGQVREVLGKTWKKADKLGRNLRKLDAEHRHEMRKALKKLRYQAEFFVPLFGKRDSERFIERLKTLQDVFGYVHSLRRAQHRRPHCFVSAARRSAEPSAHRWPSAITKHRPHMCGERRRGVGPSQWRAALLGLADAGDGRDTLVLRRRAAPRVSGMVYRGRTELDRDRRQPLPDGRIFAATKIEIATAELRLLPGQANDVVHGLARKLRPALGPEQPGQIGVAGDRVLDCP